jgi:tetratricopeptide (TPR) repeat protein
MSSNRKRLKILVQGLGLLLAASLAVPALADYKREFYKGKTAFDDGDYSTAISQMNMAISENPEPAERVKLYGMVYIEYLPYFYLGQAYFKMNDCDKAIEAWAQSEARGVISGLGQMAEMQASRGLCNAKVIDDSGIIRIAQEKIGALDAEIANFAVLENERLLQPEWAGTWGPKLTQGRQLSASLTQRLGQSRSSGDLAGIESVTSEAEDAATNLAAEIRQARAQIASIQSRNNENIRIARDNARRDLQNSIRVAKAADSPDGGTAQMSTLYSELSNLVQVGDNLASTASESNIRQQKQNIDNVLRRYNLARQDWVAQVENIQRQTPPDELKRIAEAFFSGEYERTTQLADLNSVDSDQAKVQMLLFRAAANHKLYVRSGQTREAVLREVKTDIRSIKRINSRFTPYIAAFSPGFLAIFNETV